LNQALGTSHCPTSQAASHASLPLQAVSVIPVSDPEEASMTVSNSLETKSTRTSGRSNASSKALFDLIWIVVWFTLAACQGFVTVKCLLIYPKVLADQFVFKNFVVLKMFIGAVGSSMLVQGTMSIKTPELFAATRGRSKKSYGLLRVTFGLALLGMGMAIAGSGPTMLAPGLGGRVRSAWGLLLGGILATALIGFMDKTFTGWQLPYYVDAKPLRKAPDLASAEGELIAPVLVEEVLGMSYATVSLTLGLWLVAVGLLLEVFIDFRTDVEQYGGPLACEYPASVFAWPAWPPLLAGVWTGLEQVPVRMISRTGLGGSSSLITVVSTFTCGRIWPKRTIFHNCYQLVQNYVWVLTFAMLASFTSGTEELQMTTQPITDGFTALRMASGMFLCIFGSLFAGGCTCGHGVTGISELNIESWVGGATIFAAAIATRCIMVFGLGVEH